MLIFDIFRLTAQAMDAFTIHNSSTVLQQPIINPHLPNAHYFQSQTFILKNQFLLHATAMHLFAYMAR